MRRAVRQPDGRPLRARADVRLARAVLHVLEQDARHEREGRASARPPRGGARAAARDLAAPRSHRQSFRLLGRDLDDREPGDVQNLERARDGGAPSDHTREGVALREIELLPCRRTPFQGDALHDERAAMGNEAHGVDVRPPVQAPAVCRPGCERRVAHRRVGGVPTHPSANDYRGSAVHCAGPERVFLGRAHAHPTPSALRPRGHGRVVRNVCAGE